MLAPGDLLTKPPADAQPGGAERSTAPPAPAEPPPVGGPNPSPEESDSFLLRLLRALGAIHT
jgi:hypothetical protein